MLVTQQIRTSSGRSNKVFALRPSPDTAEKNTPAGYLEVLYSTYIENSAPERKMVQMLNEGDAHRPSLEIFSRSQKCFRHVHIVHIKTIA
jgi:hypothetical protein